MKTNIFKQTGLLLCIVVAALTTSCTNNESNSNQIVGNWVCVRYNGNSIGNDISIAFREDMVYTDRTGVLIKRNSYDCKWSVVDNYLYIDFTYPVYKTDGTIHHYGSTTNEFEILDLTNTSLKLQSYSDIWEFNRK